MGSITAEITAASFPTPHLAQRTPSTSEAVSEFAQEQVAAANAVRARLAEDWRPGASAGERVIALRARHTELIDWRYRLALTTGRRVGGNGLAHDAERFRMSLREGGANYDRIGDIGRLRADATWNPDRRAYCGGTPTPASEIMAVYGRHALDRFARTQLRDPGVLRNYVTLPDSRRIRGNTLVRGAAARRIADDLVTRVAARGADASRMDVGGILLYAVTADPDNADQLFDAALHQLAHAADHTDRDARVRAWQDARYLLYQAPRTKKGSDAVTRTFLVAVGAHLLDTPPVLDHDIDLRCMVLGQQLATTAPADRSIHR